MNEGTVLRIVEVRRHMARKVDVPDLRLVEDVVAQRILDAAHAASKTLTKKKIRHVLIGGLAVGAHGYARATKDVDFLIGEEGFEHHVGGIVTFTPGIPIEVAGVFVDYLEAGSDEDVDPEVVSEGIPIVSIECLMVLKLRARRRQDKVDVVELLRTGSIDEENLRTHIKATDPKLLELFDELVEEASDE
jgi:hypothetical protein